MAVSENTKKVLQYLQSINGQQVIAKDVADALGIDVKVVNGAFTSGLQRKGLGARVPANMELPDGTVKTVQLLTLTEQGKTFSFDA